MFYFVAMIPHRANKFFIALAQDVVIIRASAICEDDVTRMLSDYPDIKVITSDLVKPDKRVSRLRGIFGMSNNNKSDVLQQLAASAGGRIIASAVSIAFSCTVTRKEERRFASLSGVYERIETRNGFRTTPLHLPPPRSAKLGVNNQGCQLGRG